MTALYKQLNDSLLTCQLEGSTRLSHFLPASELDRITEESIKAELPWVTKFLSPDLALRVALEAKRVFCILTLIQEPAAIEELIHEGITDDDLPLCRNGDNDDTEYDVLASVGGRKRFPSSESWQECKVQMFLDKQWVVQAPIFDKPGSHFALDADCPLPLIECPGEQAPGGMGVVHKVKLHPAHQRLYQADAESFVAIKEIPKKDVFDKERGNLNLIQEEPNNHLIRLLASCERGPIYYLFFPWADGGSLRDLWGNQDFRPRTPGVIRWALEQILGLVSGIQSLHLRKIRHGDIKPENVLVFEESKKANPEYGATLVLADMGISKFHKEATHLRQSATITADLTVSYEAPEADDDIRKEKPRPRRYDMWSAGCMFLEFTVWLVYNCTAVERFKARRKASNDPRSPGNFFTREPKQSAEIHPVVAEAIRHLREHPLCKAGTALGDLLTLISDRLLQIQPEDRAEAPELHNRVKTIVDAAVADPEYLGHEVNPPLSIPDFFNHS